MSGQPSGFLPVPSPGVPGHTAEEVVLQEASTQRGSVAADGATLRYVAQGTGTPVLVVGSAVYYPRTFSQPLRGHCRLVFSDLRHFAVADGRPGALTFDGYADDIDRVRAAAGLDRAAVLGHSKHGNIALEYAKRYPDRVSHVVLVGSPPVSVSRVVDARERHWAAHASYDRQAALRRNRDALGPERLATLSAGEAMVARYVADGPTYWFDPGYDAKPLWQGVPVNMPALDALHGLFAGYEVRWNPKELPAPVLVVMGRHDYVVPHVLWDEVVPRLPNVTYRLFERSGHTPQLEEPELFDRVLLDWLGGRPVAVP